MTILQKLKRKTLRALFQYDPSYTDMFTDPSELYFAKLYLYQMHPYLEQLPENAKILDAGCQAGRFTVALAKMGFRITAVDTVNTARALLSSDALCTGWSRHC